MWRVPRPSPRYGGVTAASLIRRRLLVARLGRQGERGLDLSLGVLARLAIAAAHLEIGWSGRPRRALALALAERIHDPEIMLGVLIEVFSRDPVAARLRLSRQRDIALEDLIGVAADFYVRPIAVECLDPMRQSWPVGVVMWPAATAASITTA